VAETHDATIVLDRGQQRNEVAFEIDSNVAVSANGNSARFCSLARLRHLSRLNLLAMKAELSD
jgi:hypothetical protein